MGRELAPGAAQPGSGPEGGPAARIRALNDDLRRTFTGGRVVMTSGVATLPEAAQVELLAAVRAFDAFGPDNDPHGEHDFGEVLAGVVRCFWKIDPYSLDLAGRSPDPGDPAVTVRVLTLMLAEEY